VADVKAAPALLADPAPLGLSGFALTTLILSLWNAGVLAGNDVKVVIGLAAFYGGLAQLLAGMWEFRNGNTFGATAFSSYGAFWLTFAALLIPGFGVDFGDAAKGPSHTAIGWYLIAWAIVTGLLLLGTLRINGALVAVFVLLFVTYILLAIGEFSGAAAGSGITSIGGWIGVLTAIAAWYTALTGILRGVSGGKVALPVFPMS
jgi:succinate-acetate transporter protein